jgi:hypothetical protein
MPKVSKSTVDDARSETCIFCGTENVVPEHIFSRGWLRDLWQMPAGEQTPHRHTRGDDSGEVFDKWWENKEADITVLCVCDGCNSGWMNTLDRRVYRIINPMTRGEETRIKTLKDKMILVAWATKIAYMFDFKQESAVVPADAHARLYEHRLPPDRAWIWLASSPPAIKNHAAGLTWDMGTTEAREVYLAALRIDHLVVQFLLPLTQEIRPHRPRYARAIRQLWPETFEVLLWPPEEIIDEFEYVRFLDSFVRAYTTRGI